MFDLLFLKTYGLAALGAVGLYLLLPRVGRGTRPAGALLGLGAVAGMLATVTGPFAATPGGAFYVFSTLAIVFATCVITQRKAVYSALYLVLVVLCVACLALTLGAEFLAVAMVIIYGGAIMVTYMFVIMLAQQTSTAVYDRWARAPFGACFAAFLLVGNMAFVIQQDPSGQAVGTAQAAPVLSYEVDGSPENIGIELLTRHVVVLEIAGILLLLAMVGAIAIARKRFSDTAAPRELELGQSGRTAAPF